ncbi:GumC family protein [Methylobacterium longum]|uniref:GNVR domain-containing protein n=1 Tax=Methylobacterium longum TaxID=767694 RepID=A0ABT8APG5_9HYPH|nr:Wzz/FepE/Etk N-terminal domain-containing protein [Methylobacterium longum]MDN3571304.1 GNVR domain-containing protein [Methylobacterium longum]GJE09149.1 hypothetical protein FOHLNKBM_0169 [Methylobacterium longum]
MMTLSAIQELLWRRKLSFILPVIAVFISSVLFQKYYPKTYEASTWLLLSGNPAVSMEGAGREQVTVAMREQMLKTESQIAQSPSVIQRAIQISNALEFVKQREPGQFQSDIPQNRLIELFVTSNLRVLSEPNTNLIKVTFRDKNPVFAADMADAVSTALREKHLELNLISGAPDFFSKESLKYKEELKEAAMRLRAYEQSHRIFAIADEKKLLLERLDSTSTELASTDGLIGKALGEIASLKMQIAALKSKLVLPPEIYGSSQQALANTSIRLSDQSSSDPPLLHIRIFQDSAQKLVSSNAELAGLEELKKKQSERVKSISDKLSYLSTQEEVYNGLKRDVTKAETDLLMISKRNTEAEVEKSLRSTESLSNLQIMQVAVPPLQPIWPKSSVTLILGVALGLMVGLATAIAVDWLKEEGRSA